MMRGYVVLEGGDEFGGKMAVPDRRAIELAGGMDAMISIIPTAAAPDHNHRRAGMNGVNWFQQLGATNVRSLPLIDKASANAEEIIAALDQSRLIYLLGGFPHHLGQTLLRSKSWDAMRQAYERGAVLAGSSAGAMVLCQYYFDPQSKKVVEGLGLIPGACVLPHHNAFGKNWAGQLTGPLPDAVLLGIDEQTGMINDVDSEQRNTWRAYGKGSVTLYRAGHTSVYKVGEPFEVSIG
ncbi:cyanophycinase [Dictyobacter sp. S3.2.2.5]|uniref:Cyanophycinase n=1 Tax=Dictyobacter halimunensis TaxID=3026934 RepID=A0ABQ6FPU1_9CHLR|nr:cyanophycinase [Dictyobacter sp. S3.2.2.5]